MSYRKSEKCFGNLLINALRLAKVQTKKSTRKLPKLPPKLKKQHCITYFTKSEFTLTQLSKLLDKLQKIWNIFGKLLIIALWSVKVQTKKFTGILPEMHQNGFFEKFSFFSKNSIFFSFFSKNQKSEKLPSIVFTFPIQSNLVLKYLVFFSVLLELYERHQMHDSFELLRYYQNWMLFLITRYALYSKFTTFPFRKMIIQVSVAMLLCLLHVWTNTNNFSICWFLEDLL